ncbi:hypothetical protein [Mycobacterium decipiens]|uniref:DUF222 domain-containing protein n=1 Tax=Mycobacterium decipiens TaxID=1430326 RepID=A0A1X2LR83_9MYCO|nr:hypothetical protein [Mycobacterium decipiens]OSC39071.1 hypothetical protein B8W66_18145 [Mycobacterium decipiens]
MTIELSPRVPERERPGDFHSLAAEQLDLNDAITELILRLMDHRDRWAICALGLRDAAERERASAIIEHLQRAVRAGGPAVLNPLRHASYAAHLDDPGLPRRLA